MGTVPLPEVALVPTLPFLCSLRSRSPRSHFCILASPRPSDSRDLSRAWPFVAVTLSVEADQHGVETGPGAETTHGALMGMSTAQRLPHRAPPGASASRHLNPRAQSDGLQVALGKWFFLNQGSRRKGLQELTPFMESSPRTHETSRVPSGGRFHWQDAGQALFWNELSGVSRALNPTRSRPHPPYTRGFSAPRILRSRLRCKRAR